VRGSVKIGLLGETLSAAIREVELLANPNNIDIINKNRLFAILTPVMTNVLSL
jgi:hypothetical protein